MACGGQLIWSEGEATIPCVQGDFVFQIVNLDVKPLLGLPDSIHLGLVTFGPDATVHFVDEKAPELQEYSDLFDSGKIGKLPVVYHVKLDKSITPSVCAPRRVPVVMKQKVTDELERMTKLGVITPEIEATEWVSAMVAARKKDGKVRLCIDPVHLNKALLRLHHPMKTIEQVIADMPDAEVFTALNAKCGFWQRGVPEDNGAAVCWAAMQNPG